MSQRFCIVCGAMAASLGAAVQAPSASGGADAGAATGLLVRQPAFGSYQAVGPRSIVKLDIAPGSGLDAGEAVHFRLAFFTTNEASEAVVQDVLDVPPQAIDAEGLGTFENNTVIYDEASGNIDILLDAAAVPGFGEALSRIEAAKDLLGAVYAGVQIQAFTLLGGAAETEIALFNGRPGEADQTMEAISEPLQLTGVRVTANHDTLVLFFNRTLTNRNDSNDINQTLIGDVGGVDFEVADAGSIGPSPRLAGVIDAEFAGSSDASIRIRLSPLETNAAAGALLRTVGDDIRDFLGNTVSSQAGVQIRRFRAGDLNLDGIVNGDDLRAVLLQWRSGDMGGDLNGDGEVDSKDIAVVLANWGQF